MKIWRFYLKPTDNDNEKKQYDLYEIKNNKEFANIFMQTRNMDRFYTRCTKEDKETYSRIANDNRDCVLEEFDIVTRHENNVGLVCHKIIHMIMTNYEYQCINADEYMCEITSDESWWSNVPDYRIYKKKLKNALRTLEYVSFYKLYVSQYTSHLTLEEIDDDYAAFNIWIDELGAFVDVFGSTFK